jgi:hypothetical protein
LKREQACSKLTRIGTISLREWGSAITSKKELFPEINFFLRIGRLDSVVLAEDGDCDSHDQKLPLEGCNLRREASSYNSCQEYVNSLPSSFEGAASMLSLHSMHAARNPSQENLFKKSNSLHTSHSMEDLLFLG